MDLCDSDSSDGDALVDDGSTGAAAAAAAAGGTSQEATAPVSCNCVSIDVF